MPQRAPGGAQPGATTLLELLATNLRPKAPLGGTNSPPNSAGSPNVTAKTARLPRRSAGELDDVVNKLVAIVTSTPDGINAERLRVALQVESKELPKPINLALRSGQIRKIGNKRSTLYFGAAPMVHTNAAAAVDARPPRTK